MLEARAEDAIDEDPLLEGQFDVAVARAITPSAAFLATCRRYLASGRPGCDLGAACLEIAPPGPPGTAWVRTPYPKLGMERVFLTLAQEA